MSGAHCVADGGVLVYPISVIPRGPNMEGARMKGLLREGLVVPPKESVKDVFGHMFGYAVRPAA